MIWFEYQLKLEVFQGGLLLTGPFAVKGFSWLAESLMAREYEVQDSASHENSK